MADRRGERFRAGRDRLLREHPESPLAPDKRAAFAGIPYWPHDAALRFEAVAPEPRVTTSLAGEEFPLERVGQVRLPIGDLEVYWIAVYGGGIFLPFDAARNEHRREPQYRARQRRTTQARKTSAQPRSRCWR